MKFVMNLSIIIIIVMMTSIIFEATNNNFTVAFCGGIICLSLILIMDAILKRIEDKYK